MAVLRSKTPIYAFALGLVGLLLLLLFLGWRQLQEGPRVELEAPAQLGANPALDLLVVASHGGVAWAEMRVVQGDAVASVRTEPQAPLPDSLLWSPLLDLRAAGLQEGEAELQLLAHDGWFRPLGQGDGLLRRVRVELDFTPPALTVMAATRYTRQGGSGAVAVRSAEASRVALQAGDQRYPATLMDPEEGMWVVLFPIGVEQDTGGNMEAVAIDAAGNERRRGVPTIVQRGDYARGRVRLSRDFLERRLPELLPELVPIEPDGIADAFVVLSRDRRADASRTKEQLATLSEGHPLWSGVFQQPPNTQVFSNFAEVRDYELEGEALDTQPHMGFDLASTRNAPVPAANTGVVAFAGDLGIYGNTVVIDHGLGLQTLYAHLDQVDVEVGEAVAKGQALGRSGTTGLAVGDHVHYEVLVQGQPVNPVEWWDRNWVEQRVHAVFEDAGLAEWLPR